MGHACCHADPATPPQAPPPRMRRVLWIALIVNAAMAAVEIGGGLQSASVSLLADAVDFFGDAANYGLSLAVLSLGLAWRARAAAVKGWSMGLYGAGVLLHALWNAANGRTPEPIMMGLIGTLALTANLGVAALLYRWRDGDANMRSVWLCTRNDAIGNLAVLAAAAGVFGTGTRWPDLLVAAVMALLALSAAFSVVRQARAELARAA
ncbi:cation transporter [Aquabacterium humicola]|uniref:cation transporter n=1 Tax=Aquabacterium humicola TaxID=3237377 RepID=UPI002542B27F|nr:cation transporter [Rubrivivax pictus]